MVFIRRFDETPATIPNKNSFITSDALRGLGIKFAPTCGDSDTAA